MGDCCAPTRFCKTKTEVNYDHVASFERTFLTIDLNLANIFLSKKSDKFVQTPISLYDTAVAVNQHKIAKSEGMIGTCYYVLLIGQYRYRS